MEFLAIAVPKVSMLLKKIVSSTLLMMTPGAGLTLNFFLKCRPTKCLAAIIPNIINRIKITTVLILLLCSALFSLLL